MSDDVYNDLKNATPAELLAALVWSVSNSAMTEHDKNMAIRYANLGFALCCINGWELVAPAWLRESRAQGGK